jgi:hypothetical protein
VGVWGVWGCGGCGGVFPLRSNIPRSALCATLDTYNFTFKFFRPKNITGIYLSTQEVNFLYFGPLLCTKFTKTRKTVVQIDLFVNLVHKSGQK